jgi:TonB family protein
MAAYHQGIVYIIHVYDSKKSADDLIRSFRPGLNRDLKRDLTLFGMTGKEFGFESATVKGLARFLTAKKRSYVFAAFSSILGNAEVDLPKFFDSIKFDGPTDSKVLVEGPSAAQQNYTSSLVDSDAVIYRGSEVTGKAMVISKPEPMYTEAARQARISGNVVLRCVFSASGEVTNIKPVNGLSHGLTESAIAAARQVKFIPPIKDGRFVSMFVQIEYNFNIY